MPDKYGYAWEKMFAALTTLAQHPGRIQERIAVASLAAHTVLNAPERFPPQARSTIRDLYERLTAVEDPHHGSFKASAMAMTDEEAAEIARWFVDIYFHVHRESGADAWTGGSESG